MVISTVGSSGISEALGNRRWPLSSKNRKNVSRIHAPLYSHSSIIALHASLCFHRPVDRRVRFELLCMTDVGCACPCIEMRPDDEVAERTNTPCVPFPANRVHSPLLRSFLTSTTARAARGASTRRRVFVRADILNRIRWLRRCKQRASRGSAQPHLSHER